MDLFAFLAGHIPDLIKVGEFFLGMQQKIKKLTFYIFEKALISRMDKLTHELITEIIKSRKYNYSNEPLDRFLRVHASVRCNHFSLKNKHN